MLRNCEAKGRAGGLKGEAKAGTSRSGRGVAQVRIQRGSRRADAVLAPRDERAPKPLIRFRFSCTELAEPGCCRQSAGAGQRMTTTSPPNSRHVSSSLRLLKILCLFAANNYPETGSFYGLRCAG